MVLLIFESISSNNEKDRSVVINTINYLHKRGLITRSDDEVKMHPLIQDVVRMQASSYSIYLLVLNSIIRSLDKANATFSDNGYQLQQYAQSVLDKMIGTKGESVRQPLTLLKNNLFLAYRYLGAPQKAKVLAKQLIEELPKLESLRVDDRFFLSTLHHNIASYYMDEHNLEEAEKYFKKAIEVLEGKFFIKSIQFYNGLFVIYYRQNRYKEALECCSKALAIVKDPQAGENDHLLAMITNNFATINLKLGEIHQAANFVTAAIRIHRESNSEEKNDTALAHYYSNAALTFSLLGNHELAIQFALHAIEYRGRLNLENDYELLTHYRLAADVYEKAG